MITPRWCRIKLPGGRELRRSECNFQNTNRNQGTRRQQGSLRTRKHQEGGLRMENESVSLVSCPGLRYATSLQAERDVGLLEACGGCAGRGFFIALRGRRREERDFASPLLLSLCSEQRALTPHGGSPEASGTICPLNPDTKNQCNSSFDKSLSTPAWGHSWGVACVLAVSGPGNWQVLRFA